MKHGISLEMVDLNNQEPNRNVRECKYFWDELYSLISAAKFNAIEIPYEPKWDFGGRSGIPRSKRSIDTKFENPSNYVNFLKSSGINDVTGVHLDPSIFLSPNIDMYFGATNHFATEAIDFASDLKAEYITLTATPSIGALKAVCPESMTWEAFQESFLQKLAGLVNNLATYSEKKNVKLCIKNEYWSLLRGTSIISFLKSLKHKVLLDLDTANLQIAETNIIDLINNHSDLIGCVHFTDTNFVDSDEDYKKPMPEYPKNKATQVFTDIGQGNVDFPSISKALSDNNFQGWVIFNSRQTRDIYRAILRNRSYIDNSL